MKNHFRSWTLGDVALHNQKVMRVRMHATDEVDPCQDERQLHHQILAECARRGWICLHGSMAHKSKRTLGESDFCCLLPGGAVIFIECKAGKAKLSTEQQAMAAWMRKLGHQMHVVRNFAEFLQIATGALTEKTSSAKNSENFKLSASYPALMESDGGSASAHAEPSTRPPGCA